MTRLRDRIATFAVTRSRLAKHHLDFDVAVRLGDRTVKIPVIRGIGLGNAVPTEPGIEKTVGAILRRRQGAFVDVGANIGQTLLKVLAHDWDRQYLGFDVQPFCCAYLERLIVANGLANCHVFPIGLSDENMAVPLFYDSFHDASATVVESFRTKQFYGKRKFAWVARGDDVFGRLDVPDICAIKIDVEGNEGAVLLGLAETVRRFRPFIVIEVLPIAHVAQDRAIAPDERERIVACRESNLDRIRRFVAEFSYATHRISADGRLERTDDFDMEEFALDRCNYLFVPPGQTVSAGGIG